MELTTTPYFDEFVRYYQMADWQQKNCNLGTAEHIQTPFDDDLIKHVYLYDVVERKYAGFTQIMLDLWYGDTHDHPYSHKLHDKRKEVIAKATKCSLWNLETWLYVFIVHRVTGSAINYAKSPSGYWNTVIPELAGCQTIPEMVRAIANHKTSFYTSVGYQYPAFPKPPIQGAFKRGGDYYLSYYAPELARALAVFLVSGPAKTLREVGTFMFDWNYEHKLRAYRFQYAAIIADIADFFPEYVDTASPFYYGKNAVEALSYMAVKPKGLKELDYLDKIMDMFHAKTGALPYNAEDVACDCIRWIESYIKPGHSYDALDRDKIFSSHSIKDHPFGRQKMHLTLGLLDSFNKLNFHPADDFVLKSANITLEDYKQKVNDYVAQ